MGMMSRAMKKRKAEMEQELEVGAEVPARYIAIQGTYDIQDDLAKKLHEIAALRGTTVDNLVTSRLTSLVNQYERSKILGLQHQMPYGQYKGMFIEDVIRADPRYVNYLASVSDIFVLDEEATQLLKELS